MVMGIAFDLKNVLSDIVVYKKMALPSRLGKKEGPNVYY
jgi:hypothetical protein